MITVDSLPQMNDLNGWKCAVCQIHIASDNGIPTSKYWNIEREEVYCSADHSLERHGDVHDNC